MPEQKTLARARRDRRQGKAPSTQAGEFVREEMHHIREGKHGARSAKQAIAIGLSKARRSGVDLPPPAAHSKCHGAAASEWRTPIRPTILTVSVCSDSRLPHRASVKARRPVAANLRAEEITYAAR